MLTETEYRDRMWRGIVRPSTVEGQIEAIREAWVGGNFARGEIDSLYFDVMVFEGFPIDAVPEGFRDRVVESLKAWATAPEDEKGVRIFGGIYAYEVEPDPVKRAAMKAEVEAEEAAESLFFESIVRPRIKSWWSTR